MMKTEALRRRERRQTFMTVLFTVISVLYLMPVVLVLINSLKANAFVNTETFKLPTAESFVGLKNYVKGMTFGNFAFYKVVFYSFFITIASTALILLCTSMAAWYISRVGSLVSKIVYYLPLHFLGGAGLGDLGHGLHGNLHAENLILHAAAGNELLDAGLDGVLIAGIGMNHIPLRAV